MRFSILATFVLLLVCVGNTRVLQQLSYRKQLQQMAQPNDSFDQRNFAVAKKPQSTVGWSDPVDDLSDFHADVP
jgi:hypothetical protein